MTARHGATAETHNLIIEAALEASVQEFNEKHAADTELATHYQRLDVFDDTMQRKIRGIKSAGYFALNGVEIDIEDPFAAVRADHFGMVASSDAYNLIHFASMYMDRFGMQQPNQVLKRSAPSLLQVAHLSDKYKFELVDDWLYRPTLPAVPDMIRQDIVYSYGMRVRQNRAAEPYIAWTDSIAEWIDDRKAKGCPAMRMIRHDEAGQRTTLLHRFWDGMVDVAFPN